MSWPIKQLGDIFEIARGGSPRPIDRYITNDPNGYKWIMIGDAPEGSKYITSIKKKITAEGLSKTRQVKPGDFLLTNSMSFGRPYILKTEGCIHDGWLVLSPRADNVSSDYFYHLLVSDALKRQFIRGASGAVVKNLNTTMVKAVTVPLPPLAEQKRIAGILDAADALRAKRREALAQLDSLLQATFLDLFGDPVTNPKGWNIATLDHIASRVTDGEHLNPTFVNNGMPMVMAGNVVEAGVDLSNVKYVPTALGERFRQKCGPDKGDLLLVSRGATIGRMCMVDSLQPFCLMGSVILIKVNQGMTTPAYLTGLLRCPSIRGDLYTTSGSSAQQAIYIKDIRRLKCMLPPLTAQKRYDVIAQSVAQQVPQHRAHLGELDALFASLQSRAFRGEL